jgi:hypothetical protein
MHLCFFFLFFQDIETEPTIEEIDNKDNIFSSEIVKVSVFFTTVIEQCIFNENFFSD